MNLDELEDGVSAEEQLLEVLGDKNKEEENAGDVKATLVECSVMIGRADNKDNAESARLIITSCNNDECQTLEEQNNSHLVEFGTEETNSC